MCGHQRDRTCRGLRLGRLRVQISPKRELRRLPERAGPCGQISGGPWRGILSSDAALGAPRHSGVEGLSSIDVCRLAQLRFEERPAMRAEVGEELLGTRQYFGQIRGPGRYESSPVLGYEF